MHHDDQRAPKLTAAERRMVTEAQKWVARAEPTLAAAEEVLDELGHGDSASITAAAEDVVRSTDWEQPLHDIAAPGLQAVAQGLRDAVLPTIDTTAISALRDSALGTHRPEMAQMNRKLMEVIAPTIDMSAAAGSLGFSSSTLGFARPVDTSALFMTEKTKLLGTSIFGQYMPETHKITTAINKLVPTIDTTAISALRDSALGTHRPEMAQMNRKLME
ncbi:hypothetical protein, partial [Nocardia fluminea]|uniref:hypothetical protein n=1 Tax=Nocardia fluminea TaxID=134984 RepID=UPI003D0B1100